MRLAVIVAGLTLSLSAVTVASSATQPVTSTGIAAGAVANQPAGIVVAAATGMVPKHHPHHHHYKHHYRSHMKSHGGRT
jgi:hypothetical protein